MKKISTILGVAFMSLFICAANAQQPSPATTAKNTLKNGTVITINYSSPALKGRTMGKDVEPMKGQIWRAGANEATTFEFSKNVTIQGKTVPAGKYSFFVIDNGTDWTIILNKTWKQWGAYEYKQADDVLRFNTTPVKSNPSSERLTYSISTEGLIGLKWGTTQVSFNVQ